MARRFVLVAGGTAIGASLVLSLTPSVAAAQRWRFGLQAAGGYSAWSPALMPEAGGSVAFDPGPLAAADATLWLSPSLGLRIAASGGQQNLAYRSDGALAVPLVSNTRVLTGSANLLLPLFGARPRSFLRTSVLPYLALGAGVSMINPDDKAACPVTDGAPGCGTAFTVGSQSYLLEHGLKPSALAAFGMDFGLGPTTGLHLEVGDRVMQSPVVPIAFDGNGNAVRGARSNMLMHGGYATIGLQFHTPNFRRRRGTEDGSIARQIPLLTADVGAGSAPLTGDKATVVAAPLAGIPSTVGAVLDGLQSPDTTKHEKPAAPLPVTRATRVDSVAPRPIGNDGFYDVVLDVPNVSVDEITLEVNNIHAHVSLNAKVAKLVELAVGADVGIDRVYLGIRGVQAEAHLKVDLDNVASIVDRVLTTIDRNPEIITGLLATIDNTVNTVGGVANTALAPNGVVAQTVGTVGNIANTALQPGGVVTDLVNTVGSVANTALAPNGVVAQTVATVGDVANTALAPNGVVAQTVGTLGDVANTALAPNGVVAQTVGTVGGIANTALQPGGVVSQTVSTVGDVANNTVNTVGGVANTALQPGGVVSQTVGTVGGVANNTLGTVNNVAGATLQPGGVVSQVTGAVGGAVQNLTGQGGLLSAQGINALGQTVVRLVDASGQILQRTVDASGQIVGQTVVGSVLQLPTVSQSVGANGIIQRIVRDISGRSILVMLDVAGRVLGTQVLQAAAAAAGAVAPTILPPQLDDEAAPGELDGVMQQGEARASNGASMSGPFLSVEDYDEYAERTASLTQVPATSAVSSAPSQQPPPQVLVLAATIDDKGEMVQRVVDGSGTIFERTIHPGSGQLSMQKSVGNVLRLPLVAQWTDSLTGGIVRTVREPTTGAVLALTFNQAGQLARIRLTQMGTLTGATMATASATAHRSPPSPPPTAMPGTLAAPLPLPPNALPLGAVPAQSMASAASPAPLAPNAPNAPNAAYAPNAANAPNAASSPNAASASPVTRATGINVQPALAALSAVPTAVRQTAVIDPDSTKQMLLLAQRLNDRGQVVLRVVDLDGKITERSLNAAGQLVVKKGAANARLLPLLREYVDSKGQYVRLVRDSYGAILELDFTDQGKLSRVRVLDRPDVDVTGAGAAAAQLPSAIARTVNALGQTVQHVVLTNGTIMERVVDGAGKLVQQRDVGSVLKLPALVALAQADGRLVVIARDPTGVLLEIIMRSDNRSLLSLRAIDTASASR